MNELKGKLQELSERFLEFAKVIRVTDPEFSFKMFKFSESCRQAAEEITGDMETEPEYEGDSRATWWYVCGECRTSIDPRDKYCRECGRKIRWK